MENRGLGLIAGLGLGAGLMYFLDPQYGRRRRTLLLDRVRSFAADIDDAFRAIGRDLSRRAHGLAAQTKSHLSSDDADGRVLGERVRSHIGRVVSHPGSIEVTANQGRITLSGPVLAHEVDDLLACVSAVRGVTGVENRLDVHREAGNVSGLQGGAGRRRNRPELLQENWSPGTRFLVGSAGCALFGFGLTQKAPLACVLGTAGLLMGARGGTNMGLGRLIGVRGGRRGIDVHKTITIHEPVERVFPFFATYESFPRFMRHLREVRDLGEGRSHWVAEGLAGLSASWDAVVTRFEPDELISWRSEPGALVANAGTIRFERTRDYHTRVDIRLCYDPPGGALGHLAALLFGADPRSSLDDDLVRLKSLIEEGKTSAPGKGEVTRQEVQPVSLGTPAL
jgi:uncharacterized membrane protein